MRLASSGSPKKCMSAGSKTVKKTNSVAQATRNAGQNIQAMRCVSMGDPPRARAQALAHAGNEHGRVPGACVELCRHAPLRGLDDRQPAPRWQGGQGGLVRALGAARE